MSSVNEKFTRLLDAIPVHFDAVTEVTPASGEYYFRYKDQPMSLLKRSRPADSFGLYGLFIYPTYQGDIKTLANLIEHDPGYLEDLPIASLDSTGLPLEPFELLYTLLCHKSVNLDGILDNLLSDE